MDWPVEVNVLCFAALREAVGSGSVAVRLGEHATVAELLARLGEDYPALAPHLPYVKVAVNRRFAMATEHLHPGDEVALLPPVGGG